MGAAFPPELAARYAPGLLLGEGGFGSVWRARDRELDREVAIKLLRAGLEDADTRARFLREARVTADLEHPHVVRVLDFDTLEEGAAFLVYELVDGPDLARRIEEDGPVPEELARTWGIALADALEAAHAKGILHRDVKPANVLLRGGHHPVLCDFGIARRVGGSTVRTADGLVLGSPATMAPEQVRGEEASPRSDVYALAATLYEALYGRTVHVTRDLPSLVRALSQGIPATIPEGARGRHPRLESALLKALSPDPRQRHASARELGQALAAAGTRPAAARSSTPQPVTGAAAPTRVLAASDAPRAPTPPRSPPGRGLLVLLGLAVGLFGGLLASALAPREPATSAAPPPLPTSAPEPARAAAEEVDLHLTDLESDHPVRSPSSVREEDILPFRLRHVRARGVRGFLLDPGTTRRVGEFLSAYGRWLRGLREELADPPRRAAHLARPAIRARLWFRPLVWLEHLASDLAFLREDTSELEVGTTLQIARAQEDLQAELVAASERLEGEAPALVVALLALVMRHLPDADLGPWTARLRARLRVPGTDLDRVALLRAYGAVTWKHFQRKAPGDCGALGRALEEVAPVAASLPSPAPSAALTDSGYALLYLRGSLLEACPEVALRAGAFPDEALLALLLPLTAATPPGSSRETDARSRARLARRFLQIAATRGAEVAVPTGPEPLPEDARRARLHQAFASLRARVPR